MGRQLGHRAPGSLLPASPGRDFSAGLHGTFHRDAGDLNSGPCVRTVYQASYFSSSTAGSSDLSPSTRVEQLVADCKSSSHSCKASLSVSRTFSDDRL